MEHLGPPAFNPHLKRVLKSFQNSAVNSLSGPSNFVSGWGDPSKLSPPSELEDYQMQSLQRLKMLNGTLVKTPEKLFSPTAGLVAQSPLFLPMDNTSGDKADTILEGEKIACFIVGGEKRLCLPQILNTVLREFSLQQINNICDELHIFCSRCNPEQLQMLKMNEVLPWTAPSCGLITKTDAERLCNALLHRTPEKSRDPPTPNSFKVYHECFGKCKGIFNPELYASPYAKCIECVDCHGMFSPQKFVCHSHKAQENRTCHWGFDSANWRSYLLLSKDQDRKDRFQDVLDAMKARFDFTSRFKRKESESDETLDCNKEESKKVKLDDGTYEYRGMSAFRPWSPSMLSAIKNGKAAITIPTSFGDGIAQALPSYLHTGPPVLLNPERVIPHSESSRYERHFAPNVSLAPQPYQKKSQDEDKDREPVNSRTELPKCSSPKHLMAEELRQSEDEEDYDIDVSSDTESSLKSSDSPSSVPSTPEETLRPNLISPNEADLACSKDRETELAILTQALEIRNGESDDVRKKLREDFSKLQARRAEREQNLLKTLEELRQELEYVKLSKKEKMREAAEAKRELRQEIDKLRDEQDRRCREASEERKQLQREIEALRNQGRSSPDVMKVKAKYKGQIEQLRSKVLHYETSNLQRKQEVNTLRAELRKLGKELPETKPTLASPEGSVSNGSESDQSPAGSPKVNGKPGSLSATPVSAEAVS